MRSPGTYISAVGHTGLLVWLLAGWGLSSEPLPFEITEFSVVSGEEYAQLVAARTPQPSVDVPVSPEQPVIEEQPAVPVPEVPAAPPPEPEEIAPPPAPVAPEPVEAPPPVAPPAEEEQPAIAEPITDAPPQARPAPRIASQPVVSEPDLPVDDVPAPPAAEEPADIATEQEPQEAATAPETATEIVTEPEAPSGAVETSIRPAARPVRPTPQVAEAPEPVEDTPAADPVEDDAVSAALDAALASAEPAVPQGPPMTGSERDAFRIAVNQCWNVDPGSVAARVTLTVGFSLTPEGRVDGNAVRQIAASGGDANAVRTAFEAARRAILRCQSQDGYDLPAEKYDQWKDVEITFDPSGMRLR